MMPAKNENLKLRPVTDADIGLIEAWLNKEYVRKWYGDPDEWLEEIKDENGDYSWICHFIAELDSVPVGFCQYYDCGKTGKGYSWDNEPPGTFGIDYLIGEEAYLGKSLGRQLVRLLSDTVPEREDVMQLIADPIVEEGRVNTASVRVLEANGYVYDAATKLYKYHPGETDK